MRPFYVNFQVHSPSVIPKYLSIRLGHLKLISHLNLITVLRRQLVDSESDFISLSLDSSVVFVLK